MIHVATEFSRRRPQQVDRRRRGRRHRRLRRCHRPCDHRHPCANRLVRTSAAAASTAAGASASCTALAPVVTCQLSRLYALNLPESKYKQNYWKFFQEITEKRIKSLLEYKW